MAQRLESTAKATTGATTITMKHCEKPRKQIKNKKEEFPKMGGVMQTNKKKVEKSGKNI